MERKRWDWSIALVLNQHFISETTKVSSWVEVNERQGSKQQSWFIWVSEKHFYTKYTTHRFTLDQQYLHKKRLQPSLNSLQHNTNSFHGKPRGENNPFLYKEFSFKYLSLLGTAWKTHTILTTHIYRGLWFDVLMLFASVRGTFRNPGGKKHSRKLQLLFLFLFGGAWWNI